MSTRSARKPPTPRGPETTAAVSSKGKKGATPVSKSKQLAPTVAVQPTAHSDSGNSSSAGQSVTAAVTAPPAEAATDASPSAPVAPAPKRRRRNELESLQDSMTDAAAADSEGEEEEDESKEDLSTSGGKPLAPNNGAVACTIAYQLDEGGVPVFRPSWDEFHDFARFIEAANSVGSYYGMLKVIPPPEHVPNKSGFADVSLKEMLVQNPARQRVQAVQGYPGAFQVANEDVAGVRTATVAEFEGMSLAAEAQRSTRERNMVDEANWAELERRFWSSTLSNAPLYGADSPGTLFDAECSSWNVGNLPSLLHTLDHSIMGVSLPFLYWGQWKSMFAIHSEDCDLYSINYLHFGRPKQWYTVPPRFAGRLENALKPIYPSQFAACREFLRHKEVLVSPRVLKNNGVPFITTRQQRGEYVVLWPTAYHQGFNYGFNCAESVNFTTSSWFPYGSRCGRCLCRGDTVWVSAKEVRERARKLQWLYRQEQAAAAAGAGTAAGTVTKSKKSKSSVATAAPTQLTLADVPADYTLDTSSIWLGLPTNPIHLKELLRRYYPSAVDGAGADASPMGRSMMGRSMAGRAGDASSSSPDDGDESGGFLFHNASYNQVDPSFGSDSGYADDANVAVCTYAHCLTPLHRNQRELIRHYQTVHSQEAREASAAAASAASGAASTCSSVSASAAPPADKRSSTSAAGCKRKAAPATMAASSSAQA